MLKSMIEIRIEPASLNRLFEIWPNPQTIRPGVSAYAISKQTGINEQTIRNYLTSENTDFNPRWAQVKKLESFFGGFITFCVDSEGRIDNETRLKILEDFLNEYIYKKPSK